MIKKPKVSVIVPNYNYARFLPQRMDSILGQTFGDFEIILLDDCSTDDSRRVMENYRSDQRVSAIVYNEINTGSPFRQWAKGISHACGEYIWIAESDDFALPTFLEKGVSELDSRPGSTLCFIQAECVDINGNIDSSNQLYKNYINPFSRKPGEVREYAGNEYVKHNLLWHNYIYNASGALFRRSSVDMEELKEVVNLRYLGDWLFWLMIALKGKVIVCSDRLNRFRFHTSNTTSKGSRSGESLVEMLNVVHYVMSNADVGFLRRALAQGEIYKKWKRRIGINEQQAARMKEFFDRNFPDIRRYYMFERLHKTCRNFMPGLLNPNRDRI